jgi:hypothetical protein
LSSFALAPQLLFGQQLHNRTQSHTAYSAQWRLAQAVVVACTQTVHYMLTLMLLFYYYCHSPLHNKQGHHLQSSLPQLPHKHAKMLSDHSAAAFAKARRFELQTYIRMLLTVPHVAARDTTRAFLGIVGTVREYSVLLLPSVQGGPGFAVTADAQEVSASCAELFVFVILLYYVLLRCCTSGACMHSHAAALAAVPSTLGV